MHEADRTQHLNACTRLPVARWLHPWPCSWTERTIAIDAARTAFAKRRSLRRIPLLHDEMCKRPTCVPDEERDELLIKKNIPSSPPPPPRSSIRRKPLETKCLVTSARNTPAVKIRVSRGEKKTGQIVRARCRSKANDRSCMTYRCAFIGTKLGYGATTLRIFTTNPPRHLRPRTVSCMAKVFVLAFTLLINSKFAFPSVHSSAIRAHRLPDAIPGAIGQCAKAPSSDMRRPFDDFIGPPRNSLTFRGKHVRSLSNSPVVGRRLTRRLNDSPGFGAAGEYQ